MTSRAGFVPLEALTAREPTRHWRSLEDYSAPEGVPIGQEEDSGIFVDALTRRRFLQLSAASFALAGLTGCTRQPVEKILPYVDQPENLVPGRPLYFATAVPVAGMAEGVLVESHLGRPTKVEGNPDHPATRGASSVHAQASVLDLYDPDRSKAIRRFGTSQSWSDFLSAMSGLMAAQRAKQGAGFRILSEGVTSPLLADRIDALLRELPEARWHQFDAAGAHSARAGALIAFGRDINTYFRFDHADVVLALDCDFLAAEPDSCRMSREFALRRTQGDRKQMNRLYVVESAFTPTGGKADHRLHMKYAEIEDFARQLASGLGVNVEAATASGQNDWLTALSRELLAHRGASVVIPGRHQSPAVHALCHAINHQLGNVGKTVFYTEPLQVQPIDQLQSIRELTDAIYNGQVEVLLILGGNPVYDAPADLNFLDRLKSVKTAVRVGLHDDETSAHCEWHIPESHFLEEWSDARAFDGTVTILQPLIQPLYDTRTQAQVIDALANGTTSSSYDLTRAYWKAKVPGAGFEDWWRKSVQDGLVAGSALPAIQPSLRTLKLPASPAAQGMELVFRPDPYMYDGRYANNAWLQELPQPISKLTWDNVALISKNAADKLGLQHRDRAKLQFRDQTIEISVWVSPGHPDDSVAVNLGWGRWRAGRAGNGAGSDVYPLRFSNAMWSGTGLTIQKIDREFPLATTQMHQRMEGRDLVIADTVARFEAEPDFVQKISKTPAEDFTLYPKWEYTGHAWGMSIDLTRCVNCNACVVACQAENNIPVVGKEQVLASREMHWLRIDTYFEGDLASPRAYYQPVPCMQCEDAPCELVCPVQATSHSSDGLNDMVYNRCVGTRYCSNNCPYKVRRFNFVLFQDWTTETLKLQRNPDVTVRSRGVMEKCTYCVQRIREGEIQAKLEDRNVRDGEIQTACQQSCPTQAITFGDINDRKSQVSALKKMPLDYALLAELNTRPRTTYLAELRNPNPEMEGKRS